MDNQAITPPRILRLRDVPTYIGMNKNHFNKEIRPYLTEIPIGKQGKGFDRLEIDSFITRYISSNGVPGQPFKEGDQLWDSQERLDLSNKAKSGTSINLSKGKEFAKALEKLSLKKLKHC